MRKQFLFLVFLVFLGLASFQAYEFIESSLGYKTPLNTTLKIPKGSSVRTVAKILEQQSIIKDRYVFEGYLRWHQMQTKLKAGEYVFSQGLSFHQVIEKLIRGKVKLYRFTIPEGYNLKQICKLLDQQEVIKKITCEQLTQQTDFLQHQIPTNTLEGYLFPETYLYESGTSPEEHFKNMVAMFYNKLGKKRLEQAKSMGFDLHQLITFASIIEKETGKASERPLIASVFHNRLKKGMLLQTDPTVIYGIKNFDGNIRRSDLTRDTAYNTYTRPGLPPGPICSVGLAAIDAVLKPESSDYLYFVAKGDGSHYFSKTLGQHNQAVRHYQLKRGPKPQE